MTRLLAGVAVLLLVAACASPAPTPSFSLSGPSPTPTVSPTAAPSVPTTPSPTPTPIPTPSIACTPFKFKTVFVGDDPCLSAIAAVRVVVGAVGLPIARMVIEPEAFPCGRVVWLGVGLDEICFGIFIPAGSQMRGWVSFIGTDKVDAIALVRPYPFTGGPAPTPPPWRATSLAFAVPPVGWVMPSS